ncbi:MAG TPA: DNA replication/repair protein RecF [Alphaproteobacteria bacterium]
MAFVKSVQLHAFRNYRDTALHDLHDGFIVITGNNGAGKTNILEAVSLLTPGRGIRGAKTVELKNRFLPESVKWAIAATAETPFGEVKIGTGAKDNSDRRIARVNGADLKALGDLADYLSAVWLTPQMDGLFLGSATDRRRFFDRLVYAFDPAHAGRVARYENALTQRARLLKEQRESGRTADPKWLTSLELNMAETGVAVSAARLQTLDSLSSHIGSILEGTGFPVANLVLAGGIEDALKNTPALEVEDRLRAQLESLRPHDMQNGSAGAGPHRSDLQVSFDGMPAAQCSTGEQKALLTGIILAHAVRTKHVRDAAPILLLDEIAAHFDEYRRLALFDILLGLNAQVFITGTDAALFANIPGARHMHIDDDSVREAA